MINLGFYSGNNLPTICFRPKWVDYVLMTIALLITLFSWFFAFYLQQQGTFVIANHLLLMILMTVSVVGLSLLLSFAPSSYYRFPVKVTSANLANQYLIAIRFCRVLCIWLALLSFASILMEHKEWGIFIQFATLFLFGISFVTYYAIAYHYR
ncbi:MAG: hypothetical protein E7099_06220 [Mediterranea massiliensis]|nr:hypothetical protein [Mediterranea massiliensis]